MAFGDLKGTLRGNAAAITNPFSATGSVSVAVGDLVVAVLAQQTALTVTAVGDNLHGGSTYTAQNAGSDGGNATGRMFYIRVTTAGTLTSVNAVTTASSNDVAFIAGVFEGPFLAPPIDANPANGTTDTTIPHTCPASGTLAQADELVIGWCSLTGTTETSSANAPFSNAGEEVASGLSVHANIAYLTVAATTTQTPSFSQATDAASSVVLGTASFKKDTAAGDTITVTKADISVAGQTVNEIYPNISPATISLSGQTVNEIYPNITSASISVAGQSILDIDTVLVSAASITLTGQTIGEAETVSPASVTLAGQSVLANDTELVSQATITLTGQDIASLDAEVVPVDAGAITISGQDVTTSDTGAADTTTVDAASVVLSGQPVLANDTELVDPASVALTGQSVPVNDAEPVSQSAIALTGGAVVDIQSETVTPSTVTLAGGLVIESDIVLVGSSIITLTGSDIGMIDSAADTTIVDPAAITLTGQSILSVDTELVGGATIALTGGTINVLDGAVDSVVVDPAQILLHPGGPCFLLLEDGSYLLLEDGGRFRLELDQCGDNVTVVDTIVEGGGGGTYHPRWPLYVTWHLKDSCWKRAYDCPPEIAEEIDRELPYEAPLAPEEIRRLVGTLSDIPQPDDDMETVALLAALED